MPKMLRHAFLFGLTLLIAIGFIPFKPALGNPVPSPDLTTEISTKFEGSQIKFKCANVTLDVYSAYTQGVGTYILENLANTPNTLDVSFIAWYREVNLMKVMVNQTLHNFSISCEHSGCEEKYNGVIQLDFPPNGTQVLQLWWNFTNLESSDTYYVFPKHPRWISYRTGYQINGGDWWGGIPIEWEEVRFNFHTDVFFSTGQNITVCYSYLSCYNTSSVQLPSDSNKVPYFLYHAENINKSVFISFYNLPYNEVQDDLAICSLAITTGASIAIPLFFVKKTRKPSVLLSILGFGCFLIFMFPLPYIPLPIFDYFVRGMIMLGVYLSGFGIIMFHYFLQPRLRKIMYKKELRNRVPT